jgi:hypothetical protein
MSSSEGSESKKIRAVAEPAPSEEKRALWGERIYLRFRKEELRSELTTKQSEIGPLRESLSHPAPKDRGRIADEQRALYLNRRTKELELDLKEIDGQLKAVNQRLRQLEGH